MGYFATLPLSGALNSFSFKSPVRLASTVNLGLVGLAAIDGVVPVAGDRILVKDQAAPATNGIYVASAGAWARSSDFNTSAEAVPGSIVPVTEGATQADTLWMLTTDAPITLGVTALVFSPFGAVGVDHFAPTIVVGNTAAGDPAATFPAPFNYIPDTGNGAGIALAFTSAAALVTAGFGARVHIRRGVYDFGAVGAPALPLTIAGFRVSGDGRGTQLRMSTLDRRLLLMTTVPAVVGIAPELYDVGIDWTLAAAGAVGTECIDALGSFNTILSNVHVNKSVGPVLNPDESLTSIFRSGTISRFTNCRVQNADGVAANLVVAFRMAGPTCEANGCAITGANVGFRLESTVQGIIGCTVNGGVLFANHTSVEIDTTNCRVIGLQSSSSTDGIVAKTGAEATITACNVTGTVGDAIRVDLGAVDVVVVANRVNGGVLNILEGSTVSGHNV